MALLPNIKATLQVYLPSKQHVLLSDFDRLLKDYHDHQNELHTKLINIMQDRLTVHVGKMLVLNWDAPDPKEFTPDSSVSIHISTLVKDTTNLYKVLIKFLPLKVIRMIMNDIFALYNKRLEEELKKIDFFTPGGKTRYA